ncbi:MAG: DUF4114 domain-containing protein [Chlamydiales bacterium]|nr:DUF4114 domain-containing protein [Chlamydiia bacterium]MCP5507953.1 DUF4114 domain-containing protein [Chlamydiales bacterium]
MCGFFRRLCFSAVLSGTMMLASSLFAYPDGLDIVNPIRDSGSDARAAAYNAFYTSTVQPYIDANSSGTEFNPPASTVSPPSTLIVDPSNLEVMTRSDARIYFIDSSAGYRNSFGWDPNHDFTLSSGEKAIVFPNAHTLASSSNPGDADAPYAGLTPGDFVELPQLEAGSFLDFFLLANGANGTSYDTWWNDSAYNSDSNAHVKTVHFDGTPYYLMGWEDLPNLGDADFSDVFVVVELVPVPEPSTYLILASLLVFVIFAKRRKSAFVKIKRLDTD